MVISKENFDLLQKSIVIFNGVVEFTFSILTKLETPNNSGNLGSATIRTQPHAIASSVEIENSYLSKGITKTLEFFSLHFR